MQMTGTSCSLEMEAEELIGRNLTIDSIMNKVRDIKNKINEDLTDELNSIKVCVDPTETVNQIMMVENTPENWLNFLLKLEKNSPPLNDALLNKLIGRYSQAIEALPPDKYGQNESFARIQVRLAELKAIQEPDDAHDYFQMARENCKKFAFVHVSFAQFELSQGNLKKSEQLLHKAVETGAVPLQMLETAIRNLHLQKKQLLSEEDKKSLSASTVLTAQESFSSSLGNLQSRKSSCDPKVQAAAARILYGENMPPKDAEVSHRNPLKQTNKTKRSCPFGRVPVNLLNSPDYYVKTDGSAVPQFTKRKISGSEYRDSIMPGSKSSGNDSYELRGLKPIQAIHLKDSLVSNEKSSELMSDLVTLKSKTDSSLTKLEVSEPKVRQEPEIPERRHKQWQSARKPGCGIQNSAAFAPQWHVPDVTPKADKEISGSSSMSECISVNGRIYSILKQIGSGGSSKVFQVLNEKKQINAIKYVNLEDADSQTIDSYRNEIAYLNKLQQHSDKIIRLYDYEITDRYIYMVMECGNIDLNSWLKKKKSINPWERKSYWKNMLEAVHTIHQHGIVHSDLKPANFLIVDGMLKLIDFGIANQMQPDTTSIVKDSQVGTVNYMAPEAIRDMSSSRENGKIKTKISPRSDVWSLGCILYYMTYGKTPFQHIINQVSKLHAIIDPSHEIEFPEISEKDLRDVLKCCLVRNPKERISIPELLAHPYVQIQPHPGSQMAKETTDEMKYMLGQLVCLNSPNSILKAAKTLYERYNCGESQAPSSSKTSDKKRERE
ncbi:dual specificity protein kinase TTK isoform X6 [Rattus norvegicus]|uniref:dual specificity protein kinase TTK isoform X6 n=1 Tax=Rattus norvegicus TaxID=10116 RepID=UPI00191748C3|nr:dual specificity protein kinase TTK isoform X6 [Rattus norvegicus]